MKRFLLFMLVAVVALSACSQATLEYPEDFVEPRSGITLQFSLSESTIIQTRAQSPAETTLNNLWLFVFNSSGTLAQKFKARIIINDVHTADFTIKEGVGLGFYVCANVSAAEETKFDGLVSGSARVADLKAITTDRSLLSAPGLPMWGELLNQTITASTMKLNMTLTRSCSRVDVGAGNIADFGLYGIEKLLKTATVGPISPGSSLVTAGSTMDVVPTDKTRYSIYLYENAIVAADEATAESKATAVIVRATYKGFEGYYKLRIKYGTPAKYDIWRNVVYSINITSVKAPGFATLAEAEANFPQNVDYTITVSDGDATDLVTSNGQYYLGVTNSEYVAYNSDAMNYEAVVTVTHNAPSSITAGTVTASGAGLTIRTPTIPTSTQKQEIRVDMANYFTSGTLTIRLGNLIKVVTIKKMPTLNMNGGVNYNYATTYCVQGDWDQDPTWCRFATDAIMGGFTTRRVQNPNGGIWLRFDRNIGLANIPRSTRGYVTSIDSKGRSRIVVTQESGALHYVSGVLARIPSINPAALSINVMTDLPGWTIKAKDLNMQPFPITLGAKTGTPVRGTPTNCSIPVTVPSNLGTERTIYLYLCANEDPSVELFFTTFIQEKVPATISLSIGSSGGIPYYGGTVTTTVTSTHAWYTSWSLGGITITPASGAAGSTNVSVIIPQTLSQASRNIEISFITSNAGYTAKTPWVISQIGYSIPFNSYIPSSVLLEAGWPKDRLPDVGLQVAVRGSQGTVSEIDPQMQWKTDATDTPGVEHSTVSGTDRVPLGNGKSNTDAMMAAGINMHPAARYCRQMGPEWYLPNLAELRLIYKNRNTFRFECLFNVFPYWSSTANSYDNAWMQGFNDAGDMGWPVKTLNQRVRCVREI